MKKIGLIMKRMIKDRDYRGITWNLCMCEKNLLVR